MTTASPHLPAPGRLRRYASFVRFEHTLFSLPLILAGVFSADGRALEGSRWAWIAAAAVGARTAAMTLNRLIDRHLDARNPRTAGRELPAGRMKPAEAVALLIASTAVYLAACAALGPWFVKVALLPLAVFALYPYLKRFTPFCHAGVGTALALAPLAGFAAAHPQLQDSLPAWGLAAFAFCWVTGFDIIYATLDEAFDRQAGVRSMVVWLGRARALRVSWALHVGAISALAWSLWRLAFDLDRDGDPLIFRFIAPPTGWSNPFWLTLTAILFAAAAVMLWLEQRWAEDVNFAFFKINVAVGFLVLLAVLAARMTGGGF
jgi:4-hydroxybenzoate polyprenyltransferase